MPCSIISRGSFRSESTDALAHTFSNSAFPSAEKKVRGASSGPGFQDDELARQRGKPQVSGVARADGERAEHRQVRRLRPAAAASATCSSLMREKAPTETH